MTQHKNLRSISLVPVVFLVLTVYLLQFLSIKALGLVSPENTLLKISVILRLTVTFLLPLIVFVIYYQLRPIDAFGLSRPPWGKTILAVVIGMVLILTVNMWLPQIIPPSRALIQTSGSITAYANLPEFLLAFLTAVVFASVTDELFFRGLVLQYLLKRYGKILAIVLTALLTALFHTLEPFKLVHAFLMGVIFASSVIWTRRVYTSIILHGLHNALALIPQG
ncbi:MAG TPA: type II CAAX endopeptidase family protein [bacterium]|nr:type II CAAX endopeptidase family protein [bacterium]